MEKIETLNELAQSSEDISQFGLKAEGLAELIQRNDGSYIVDPGFGISVEGRADSPEAKEHFEKLTAGIEEPAIIMARSSDPEEVPGKFESHTFMHTPGETEASYKDFLEAVEKVKASGARAVVCQKGAMILDELDVAWDHESDDCDTIKEAAFSVLDNGFVYNTQSRFGEGEVICAVRGLPSKIVRGDQDVTLIRKNEYDVDALNLGHNYAMSSSSHLSQDSLDAIMFSDPKNIVKKKPVGSGYFGAITGGGAINSAQVPFWCESMFSGPKEMKDLFEILGNLKIEQLETEIEGSYLGMFEPALHLFQIRHYSSPESRVNELSQVAEDKLLMGPFPSYVGDRIEGDLNFITSEQIDNVQKGQVVFWKDYDSLIYGMDCWKTEEMIKDIKNKDIAGVVIPIRNSKGLYAGVHEMGVMTQELWMLQQRIPAIAMDAGHMDALEHKVAGQIIPNIVVESDSNQGQIYHK